MAITLSGAQMQRIRELDGASDLSECSFDSESEREAMFRDVVEDLSVRSRSELRSYAKTPEVSEMQHLQNLLAKRLVSMGFMQVHTPTLISTSVLDKMGMDIDHPLRRQVFYLDDGKRCLRPMLAPNLYVVMRRMARSIPGRFGIFEIGKCYRKESKGSHHLEEFTMLNLVEIRPVDRPETRIKDLARQLALDVSLPIETTTEESDVYGRTIDLTVDGVELASAAFGPHPMDGAFNVNFPWVGIGIGLERVLMLQAKSNNIHRHASSLVYHNGTRMDI